MRERGVTKRIILYLQRRFAKVGKAAACILEARDILSMLLDEVQFTNQLVESCKIYIASDLFVTELECLAYFNHHITFPFLNCVEVSSQDIFPELYKDLLECKVGTLDKFVVSIHGVSTPKLSTDAAKAIMREMCVPAAEAIKLQCRREYGFSDQRQHATDLSKLTASDRSGLPTNNCISERDLSKFDKESILSKCRNRKFRAKNIRNNMMLYKCKRATKIDRVSKRITVTLLAREKKWNEEPKVKLKARIEEKLRKASKQKDYTQKLLRDCK